MKEDGPQKVIICRDSLFEVSELAFESVENTLCTAQMLIANDPERVFFYKNPATMKNCLSKRSANTNFNINSLPDSKKSLDELAESDESNPMIIFDAEQNDFITWPTIERFVFSEMVTPLRDYIDLWQLTASTKCSLVPQTICTAIRNKGRRYYFDAFFSKPTLMCPNPLPIAKVHFYVHVPFLIPQHYTVMVTYRFESFKMTHYAVGTKQMPSFRMPRLYIDAILRCKLDFYSQFLDCLHPRHHNKRDPSKEKNSKVLKKCDDDGCGVPVKELNQ